MLDASFLSKTESEILLSVTNDGERLPDDFDPEKSSGFGLMLVKLLSRQLDGTFTIGNRDNGTESSVRFPVPGADSSLCTPSSHDWQVD